MDTFQQVASVGRKISLLGLLVLSAVAYFFSAVFFAILRYDSGLDYRIVVIALGYILLFFAVSIEFVALRFVVRGMRRTRIAIACLIPFLLATAASVYLISIRNYMVTPPPRHHR